MSDLATQQCKPCEGGIPPLTGKEITPWMEKIDPAWTLTDGEKKIRREFVFSDFREAIEFVNRVAEVAEAEGHHPDISIFYNKVMIELWTHKINGLFDNDFILAAKIDEL